MSLGSYHKKKQKQKEKEKKKLKSCLINFNGRKLLLHIFPLHPLLTSR